MYQNITFKTELNEIISLEEITILFDNITLKCETSLVSVSLYPDFMNLKKDIIHTATIQRNFELSTLLKEIAIKKEEINNKIQFLSNELENNRQTLVKIKILPNDLEQTIYEQEQMIKAYKESLFSLESKEKKIMSCNYKKNNIVNTLSKTKSLKKQLEYMKNNILFISAQHDNCFKVYEKELDNLINNAIIAKRHMATPSTQNKYNGIFEKIEDVSNENEVLRQHKENNNSKDFYVYEYNELSFADKLIYDLLKNEDYTEKDGSINKIIIPAEYNIE